MPSIAPPDSSLAATTHPVVATVLADTLGDAEAKDLIASLAPSTWRAYRPAWTRWAAWTAANNYELLPTGETTSEWIGWLTDSEGLALPTIRKHVAALATLIDLAVAFDALPHDTLRPTEYPRVRRRLAGRARTDQHQPAAKRAITTGDVIAAVEQLATGSTHKVRRTRDTAVLLLAYAGAFRRSELSALDIQDLTFRQDGYLEVLVRRSKRDQEAHGHVVGIAPGSNECTCPIYAVQRWIDIASLHDGPLFRPVLSRAAGRREFVQAQRLDGRSIAAIIKRAASSIGIDPTQIGGHSTRRGHITQAINAGATDGQIAAITRQSRVTIDGYTAARNVTTNSSKLLGL